MIFNILIMHSTKTCAQLILCYNCSCNTIMAARGSKTAPHYGYSSIFHCRQGALLFIGLISAFINILVRITFAHRVLFCSVCSIQYRFKPSLQISLQFFGCCTLFICHIINLLSQDFPINFSLSSPSWKVLASSMSSKLLDNIKLNSCRGLWRQSCTIQTACAW